MVANVNNLLTLLASIVAWAVYKILTTGKRSKGLPPGPPTVPLLGNALQIPPRYAHLYFQDQARALNSDIISFKVFDGTLVVLNSAQATHDLFDKRSASFADRPPNWITNEYICRGQHILLARGKHNQVLRKLWNKMLGPSVVAKYQDLQEAEACAVLYNVTKAPTKFYEGNKTAFSLDAIRYTNTRFWSSEMKRYSCSLTLTIAHGKRAPTYSEHDRSGFSVADFYRLSHEFTGDFISVLR